MKNLSVRLVSVLVVAVGFVYFLNFSAYTPPDDSIEEPYWTVSKFETSFWQLKADLGNVKSDDLDAREKAKMSLSLFLSKLRTLTRDSPVRDYLMRYEIFATYQLDLHELDADFQGMDADDAIDHHAGQLIQRLDRADSMIADLAASVWNIQLGKSDSAYQTATMRAKENKTLANIVFGIVFIALVVYFYDGWRLTRVNKEIKQKNMVMEQQKLELERTIFEKNQFMGMVSHELKSPLQTISSSAESLKNPVEAAKKTQLLDRIQRAAMSMSKQINDLLALARSEAGALEYRPDEFLVQDLLDEVRGQEMRHASEKDLQLSVHAPEEPIFAIADSGRLLQILGNLTNNAIKYTSKGHVELSLRDYDARQLVFTVQDTGPGIPSGFQPLEIRPFTRFGDLDSGDGGGIGLKIAYSLTEYLSGRLELASSSEGTRFTLTVPACVQLNDAQARPLSLSERRPQQRWLLVDDNAELLASLQSECQSLGIEADTASSAAIAANMMAAIYYTVALIDVHMPGRRGDDLAHDFRRGKMMANPDCLLYGITAVHVPEPPSRRRSPFVKLLDKPIRVKDILSGLKAPTSDSPSALRGDRPVSG